MNPKETIPDGASAPSSTTDNTNPLDVQVGGSHYKQFPIQPAEFSERNGLTGLEFCVVKRVCRHSRGGKGRQDIEKAIHELQLLLEFHYPASAVSGAQDAPAAEPANSAHEDDKEERRELIGGLLKYANGSVGSPADAGMWRSVLFEYLHSHPTATKLTALDTFDLRRLSNALNRAAAVRTHGAYDIKIKYRPAAKDGDPEPGARLTYALLKTDPQNEKTDSENQKCGATDAKSEATLEFKPGDHAMLEGVEVEILGRPISSYLRKSPLDRWKVRYLTHKTDLVVTVHESHLHPMPAKTDSATAEPPVAEPKRGVEWPVRGARYTHPEHGESVFISSHPEDGALMVLEAYDAAADEHYYYGCERHKLTFASAGVSERIAENLVAKAKASAPPSLVTANFSELELRVAAHGTMSGIADSVQNMPRSAELDAMCDKVATSEPPAAEPQSEAPKVVNTLNIDIGAGYAAMAKTFVRAIPNPTRYLGKHPALGASYELGEGGIAGLSPDSPFRAGGIVDRGEAILPKGEEATAAGEAWAPKAGDKVRVVRKIKSHGGWKNYWVDLMDGAVGQVGRVKDFTDEDRRDNAVQLEFEGDPDWSDFWYPIPALERVTDAED